MSVSFEKFRDWAESRFGDIIVSGDEIKINSLWQEDYKHHCWCSPKGGKKNVQYGTYHCWKTDKSGTLAGLVMYVDKCSFDEALEKLGAIDLSLVSLEQRIHDFFDNKDASVNPAVLPIATSTFELPSGTYPILSLPENNIWRIDAENYILERRLDPKNYLICTEDEEYKNRIVIPYYNQSGQLIYWNARTLIKHPNVVKYLGPKKSCGVGKSDVIYISGDWPANGTKVYFSEGEFDSDSIKLAGLFSGALGGKELEEKQLEQIRRFIPVLCMDTDSGKGIDAGGRALIKIGKQLKARGFDTVLFVRPPMKFKDWNKMLQEVGPRIMKSYILENEQLFTNHTPLELEMQKLF